MSENPAPVEVDLSPLYEIAGGDSSFVMALLMKMTEALPIAFTGMKDSLSTNDWEGLRSTAHKAKSTFAYLGLDDMKHLLRDIEHNAREETNLDEVPTQVASAVTSGEEILSSLKLELAKLM